MPQPTIEQLVDEILELEPTLRSQRSSVTRLVASVVKVKPQLTISPTTLQQLKSSLMNATVRPAKNRWLLPTLVGVPVTAVATFLVFLSLKTPTSTHQTTTLSIARDSANAFGDLQRTNYSSQKSTESLGLTTAAPTGAGGYAADVQKIDTAQTIFTTSETFTIPNLPVLKRGQSTNPSTAYDSLNLFAPSTFAGLSTDSLSISQATSDGYTITVDYRSGSVSMYRKESSTAIEPAVLGTPEAMSSRPVSATTVSSTAAIDIAKNFARQHGIDLSGYGDPYIQTWIGQTEPTTTVTTPASVVFPLSINGVPVYDESGYRFGVQFTIDGEQHVQAVNNLSTLSFTASDYPLSTSTKAVTDYLGRGGWLWASAPTGTTKAYAVTAPVAAYMVSYYQLDATASQMFVPAIVFQVAKNDQAAVGRPTIVVPVVESLLQLNTTTSSADAGSVLDIKQ